MLVTSGQDNIDVGLWKFCCDAAVDRRMHLHVEASRIGILVAHAPYGTQVSLPSRQRGIHQGDGTMCQHLELKCPTGKGAKRIGKFV